MRCAVRFDGRIKSGEGFHRFGGRSGKRCCTWCQRFSVESAGVKSAISSGVKGGSWKARDAALT